MFWKIAKVKIAVVKIALVKFASAKDALYSVASQCVLSSHCNHSIKLEWQGRVSTLFKLHFLFRKLALRVCAGSSMSKCNKVNQYLNKFWWIMKLVMAISFDLSTLIFLSKLWDDFDKSNEKILNNYNQLEILQKCKVGFLFWFRHSLL